MKSEIDVYVYIRIKYISKEKHHESVILFEYIFIKRLLLAFFFLHCCTSTVALY